MIGSRAAGCATTSSSCAGAGTTASRRASAGRIGLETKGKVERPIRYPRESLRYGRTFLGDADLTAQCDHWLATVANQRVHGTTTRVPSALFETEERAALQPLPARPYVSRVLAPVTPVVTVQRADEGVRVERRPLAAYAALGGEA